MYLRAMKCLAVIAILHVTISGLVDAQTQVQPQLEFQTSPTRCT